MEWASAPGFVARNRSDAFRYATSTLSAVSTISKFPLKASRELRAVLEYEEASFAYEQTRPPYASA